VEFCDVVKKLGWHTPAGSLSIDDPTEEQGKAYTATRDRVRKLILEHCGNAPIAIKRWADTEELATDSYQNREEAAAYPPGACAAQKAILLARAGGAYPGALTEQWFHSKGNPTSSPIRFLEASTGKITQKRFGHGETVPPCKACELIIPLMLCPGEKESLCQHKE
jgi:hypothetical protein